MRSVLAVSLLVASGLGFVACGDEPVSRARVAAAGDNDIVNISDAVNTVAGSICDKYSQCDGFGADKKYTNNDDCLTSEKADWADKWDGDNCVKPGHGPVAGKVEACADRANAFDCSGNIFDLASEWTQCSSGNVCR